MKASSGGINTGDGAILNNLSGATINNTCNENISTGLGSGVATINNDGTFRKSSSTGTTQIYPAFNNTGIVEAQSGTLYLGGSYSQTAGSTWLNGGTIQSPNTLSLAGGSLQGTGTVSANVNASGADIAPGNSAGSLVVDGYLSLGSTASLTFELGGTTQGTSYDYLDVNGTLTLGDSTLKLSFLSGFQNTVSAGDQFTLVTANSLSGVLGNVADGGRLTTTDGYGSFKVHYGLESTYDDNYIVLDDYQAVPEPHAYAWIVSLGLLGFAAVRRTSLCRNGRSATERK